jgi:hypothetical protein
MNLRNPGSFTERSILVAAEYVESSQTLHCRVCGIQQDSADT